MFVLCSVIIMTYLKEIPDLNLLDGDFSFKAVTLGYTNSNGATIAQSIFGISLKKYFLN